MIDADQSFNVNDFTENFDELAVRNKLMIMNQTKKNAAKRTSLGILKEMTPARSVHLNQINDNAALTSDQQVLESSMEGEGRIQSNDFKEESTEYF